MKSNKALNKINHFFIIFILGITVFTGCNQKEVQTTKAPKNVTAVKASLQTITTETEAAGILKPIQQVAVSPKTAGKVSEVKVNVGDKVTKGQVLFTLDQTDLKSQLQQQQAALKVSQANLEKTKSSSFEQQVLQAEQLLQNKQLAYDDAKRKCDINKQLYDNGAVPEQTLKDSEKLFQNTAIDLKAAQDNLTLLKEKSGPESIDIAAAGVNQAAAGVHYITEQMENTVITAPISGTIVARTIDEGETATASSPSIVISSSEALSAEMNISEETAAKLKKGASCEVTINALSDASIKGIIDTIIPASDGKTQGYTVTLLLPEGQNDLRAGMFARILLPIGKKENILCLPNEAVKYENGAAVVYTVSDDVVKKVFVTAGLHNAKITEMIDGLQLGAEVITEGQNFLNDGQKVHVISK